MNERWCEIANDKIINTIIVDPDTAEGQQYLGLREVEGALLLPEAEAQASYPYA